jgi:hypothetical protein
MRYAQIDTQGNVVNMIEAEEGFSIEGFTLVLPDDKAHIGGKYENGVFSEPVPPILSIDPVTQAKKMLTISDKTILRCYEKNVSIPAEWITYRDTLRAIALGTSQDPLPKRPDYPIGS